MDYARAGRGLLDGEAEVIFYSRCRKQLGVLNYRLILRAADRCVAEVLNRLGYRKLASDGMYGSGRACHCGDLLRPHAGAVDRRSGIPALALCLCTDNASSLMQYLRYLCAVNELCAVLHGCVAVGKSKLYGVEIVHSRNIDRAEHVLGDARLKQVRFVAVDELCLKAGELEVVYELCRGVPLDLIGDDLHVVAVVVKLKVRAELFLKMLEHILASHKQLHLRFAAGDPVYKSARCARRSERGITAFKNCDGSAGFAE